MVRSLVAALLLAGAPLAQQVVTASTDRHGAILATKDGLVLPAGEFAVNELIDAVATFLCRNYAYEPTVVARAAPFSLQRALALDALGAEEVLHALLAARDLAAIPVDEPRGLHRIVVIGARADTVPAVNAPWRTPEEVLARPRLHDLAMTAIEVHRADATTIAQALRNHFAPAGPWNPGLLTAYAAGPDLLLLHGFRDQLAQVIRLVRQLDDATDPPADRLLLERITALEREVAALRKLLADRPR